MKKIVAIVLSLVMVLGLATVATAATFEDGETYTVVDGTDSWTVTYHEADAVAQNVEYFDDAASNNYVVCAKGDKGAFAVKDGTALGDPILGYVKVTAAPVSYDYVGTPVAKSVLSCTTNAVAKGYTADVDENGIITADEYFVDAEAGTVGEAWLLVDGKVKRVDAEPMVEATHFLYQNKTAAVSTGVYEYKCAVCGEEFNATANILLAGQNYTKYDGTKTAAAQAVYTAMQKADYLNIAGVTVNGGTLYLLGTAPAADATDKVESAETFDAGIAMYVGMSVMAAAGSAVVLKKKD